MAGARARPARRLKLYAASLGFYETVVAAPNQAEALRAWGVRQNLFAEGRATVTGDPAARAALDHPGRPLRRPIGTKGAYSLDPPLPQPPLSAPPQADRPRAARAPAPPPPPSPRPDRSALDQAEADLERLKAQRRGEAAVFKARRQALAKEEAEAEARTAAALEAAEARVARARLAYTRAGGR